MKAVRGKGNRTTEVRFRAALISNGISGWRLNFRALRGSPDIYFPLEKLAVFLDGCFWHGCEYCGHFPQKNREFWRAKIVRNRERDAHNSGLLRRQGISVLRFWEHDIRDSLEICVSKTKARLAERRKLAQRGQRG